MQEEEEEEEEEEKEEKEEEEEKKEKKKKQGRIHSNPCRGRLGGGSKLGRDSNDLGRGSKSRSHYKSKSVTNRPTDQPTDRQTQRVIGGVSHDKKKREHDDEAETEGKKTRIRLRWWA